MSTPVISAPMVGESGWTLTEVARVTGQFCPSRARRSVNRPPATAYIGPSTDRRSAVKGAAMSDDTGRPRPHPAGPQLLALVPVDDPPGRHHPRGPAARGRPRGHSGLAGAPPRPPGRAARARARAGPARPRDARVGGLRRLPAGQGRLRHRGHHVGARLPARPRRPREDAPRGRPSWPVTATGRASRRWSGSSTPTCPTPTTRCSWSAGATSCWRPTCAASASASTGTPRTTTPATPTSCTPPWRAGTRWRRTSGTCGARSTCWSSTRWSTRPASAWSASPTAAPSRSSPRPSTTGWRHRW